MCIFVKTELFKDLRSSIFILFTENGIGFGLRTYPICLPTTSNDNPQKWKGKTVEVIGFAPSTGDFSGTRGERMKVAEMEVFTQTTCNVKLEQKLINHEECKYC